MNAHRPGVRRTLTAGLLATTLAVSAACTADPEPPRKETAPSALPDRSVGSAPTLEAKPVPMQVRVSRVVGEKLRKPQRQRLQKQVGRLVSDYFDDAFLGGEYPRSDFAGGLAAFSPGAVERAASDRELLTNAAVGPDTASVTPRSKRAHLDVLVPNRWVAGLTARIRLVFVREPVTGPTEKVTVKGRLMLNRKKSGPWQVFGYDVSRSTSPVGRGGGR